MTEFKWARWEDFYKFTKGKPPWPLVIKAVSLLTRKENALELGSGAGRDTAYLLEQGFHVTGVDKDKRCVFVSSVDRENIPVEYDFLILATGVTHSYFGHNEFAQFAPGLKSLADAVAIRNRILQAFEQAEAEEDPARHRDLLTFVLVGAGPTGVEMAGALIFPAIGIAGQM